MPDLFGLEQQTPRKNDRPEAAALVEVLKALNTHAAVAWCERMNSGAARLGDSSDTKLAQLRTNGREVYRMADSVERFL